MTKFDLDTLKSLCKSMFDHWRKAAKTNTNRSEENCNPAMATPIPRIFRIE